MKRTTWSPAELASMAVWDAWVDAQPALEKDLAAASARDREIRAEAEGKPRRSGKRRYADLTDEQKAQRVEYDRQYRARNREAYKAKRRARYEQTREHALAVGRAYRERKKLEDRNDVQ